MPAHTSHFGFTRIGFGDDFGDEGYKFSDDDRVYLDQLLYALLQHRHSGVAAPDVDPAVAPTLTLDSTQGQIPAGLTVRYRYALVDADGLESAASPEASVATPALLATPNPPAVASIAATGGSLLAGQYAYALSAYTDVNTSETKASTPIVFRVPGTTTTNVVELTLPALPVGATGWNIYRRAPGAPSYRYLTSTTSTSFSDDGSVAEDCDRTTPTRNTTRQTNQVTVELPGPVPVGYTWRLYRTYVASGYTNTLLHWVVEQTVPGTVDDSYVDTGGATTSGAPSNTSKMIGDGEPLPLGALVGFPQVEQVVLAGTVAVAEGLAVWVCEYPRVTIVGFQLTFGRDLSLGNGGADGDDVLVDVNEWTGASPMWQTIFSTQANRPVVADGDIRSTVLAVPDRRDLVAGDRLTFDVDQVGGGPAEHDLTITMLYFAEFDSMTGSLTDWS